MISKPNFSHLQCLCSWLVSIVAEFYRACGHSCGVWSWWRWASSQLFRRSHYRWPTVSAAIHFIPRTQRHCGKCVSLLTLFTNAVTHFIWLLLFCPPHLKVDLLDRLAVQFTAKSLWRILKDSGAKQMILRIGNVHVLGPNFRRFSAMTTGALWHTWCMKRLITVSDLTTVALSGTTKSEYHVGTMYHHCAHVWHQHCGEPGVHQAGRFHRSGLCSISIKNCPPLAADWWVLLYGKYSGQLKNITTLSNSKIHTC